MIRTRCPHCNKLLGIVDSAAGMVTTCPGCKQKFRAPAAKAGTPPTAAPKPPSPEDFPEVELVEDGGEEVAPPRKAAAAPGQRLPPRQADPDEGVAARDDEDEAPTRKADRTKKKKIKGAKDRAGMAWRNRLMGAVGAAAGLFLIAFGMMNQEILNVTAQAKAFNPSLEAVSRFATIGFGAILVLVGGYYLVIDLLRK